MSRFLGIFAVLLGLSSSNILVPGTYNVSDDSSLGSSIVAISGGTVYINCVAPGGCNNKGKELVLLDGTFYVDCGPAGQHFCKSTEITIDEIADVPSVTITGDMEGILLRSANEGDNRQGQYIIDANYANSFSNTTIHSSNDNFDITCSGDSSCVDVSIDERFNGASTNTLTLYCQGNNACSGTFTQSNINSMEIYCQGTNSCNNMNIYCRDEAGSCSFNGCNGPGSCNNVKIYASEGIDLGVVLDVGKYSDGVEIYCGNSYTVLCTLKINGTDCVEGAVSCVTPSPTLSPTYVTYEVNDDSGYDGNVIIFQDDYSLINCIAPGGCVTDGQQLVILLGIVIIDCGPAGSKFCNGVEVTIRESPVVPYVTVYGDMQNILLRSANEGDSRQGQYYVNASYVNGFSNATIHSSNDNFEITCSGDNSCNDVTIEEKFLGNANNQLIIYCQGNNACSGTFTQSNIYSMQIYCQGTNSCNNMNIYCRDEAGSCSLNGCYVPNSCNNLRIYSKYGIQGGINFNVGKYANGNEVYCGNLDTVLCTLDRNGTQCLEGNVVCTTSAPTPAPTFITYNVNNNSSYGGSIVLIEGETVVVNCIAPGGCVTDGKQIVAISGAVIIDCGPAGSHFCKNVQVTIDEIDDVPSATISGDMRNILLRSANEGGSQQGQYYVDASYTNGFLNATIHSSNDNFDITCSGDSSCNGITIEEKYTGTSDNTLRLYCSGTNACSGTFTQGNIHSMEIYCQDSDSCNNMDIYCRNEQNACTLNGCSLFNSCNDVRIYSLSGIDNVALNVGTFVEGVQIYCGLTYTIPCTLNTSGLCSEGAVDCFPSPTSAPTNLPGLQSMNILAGAAYPEKLRRVQCAYTTGTSIYCFGGDRASGSANIRDTIQRFDLTTFNFTQQSAVLIETVKGYSNAVYHNDIVYILDEQGDNTGFETFIVSTRTPGYLAFPNSQQTGIRFGRGCLTIQPENDTLWMTSGRYSPELLSYDISTSTWIIKADMAVKHPRGQLVYMQDMLYVFGSDSSSASLIELYDIATNTWSLSSATNDLPAKFRQFAAIAYANRYIYLLGGRDGAAEYSDTIYEYQVSTDTLTLLDITMPLPVRSLGCTFSDYDNKIYCFCGQTTGVNRLDYVIVSNILNGAPVNISDDTGKDVSILIIVSIVICCLVILVLMVLGVLYYKKQQGKVVFTNEDMKDNKYTNNDKNTTLASSVDPYQDNEDLDSVELEETNVNNN